VNYLDGSRIVTLFAALAISYGLYDQALKIWRTKSVRDFTLSIIAALLFNEAAWLNYGVALREWPIITIGCLNIPAASLIVLGYIRYRKQ